jgi:hypothetical protein
MAARTCPPAGRRKAFALGAQIIAGVSDPLEVSGGYARVAEAAIEVLAAATVEEFARSHGRVPDSELVILALGRMGGQALTHASDLDLVYLFTGDYAAESDGAKPLGAVTYYNRLSAARDRGAVGRDRGGAALRSRHAAAALGRAGAAIGVARRFARYQREDAWTWEHMALTRARPVFGSRPRARRCRASSTRSAERRPARARHGRRCDQDARRDGRAQAASRAARRQAARRADWSISNSRCMLQLRHRTGVRAPASPRDRRCWRRGAAPGRDAAAHDLLSRLLVTLRLVAPDAQPPAEATQALIARAVGLGDWDAVVASLERTRQEVARLLGGDPRRRLTESEMIERRRQDSRMELEATDGSRSRCPNGPRASHWCSISIPRTIRPAARARRRISRRCCPNSRRLASMCSAYPRIWPPSTRSSRNTTSPCRSRPMTARRWSVRRVDREAALRQALHGHRPFDLPVRARRHAVRAWRKVRVPGPCRRRARRGQGTARERDTQRRRSGSGGARRRRSARQGQGGAGGGARLAAGAADHRFDVAMPDRPARPARPSCCRPIACPSAARAGPSAAASR